MISEIAKSTIRALIAAALPFFHFKRIETLFFTDEDGEVSEFAGARGVLISSSFLCKTVVAGNRVANTSEIWLYPDGTLHEYLEAATWETFEGGCTQRLYVGPAREEQIAIEDLQEQIAIHMAPDWEESDEF